jgi:hypothetical protein
MTQEMEIHRRQNARTENRLCNVMAKEEKWRRRRTVRNTVIMIEKGKQKRKDEFYLLGYNVV